MDKRRYPTLSKSGSKLYMGIGIITVLSTPFTGLIGFLGGPAVFFVGYSQLKLNTQKQIPKKTPQKSLETKASIPNHELNYSIPEKPETAIARRMPTQMTQLLERESKRKRYNEALSIGASVAESYLRDLSPEEYLEISSIKVIPEQETIFGKKSLEVRIKK